MGLPSQPQSRAVPSRGRRGRRGRPFETFFLCAGAHVHNGTFKEISFPPSPEGHCSAIGGSPILPPGKLLPSPLVTCVCICYPWSHLNVGSLPRSFPGPSPGGHCSTMEGFPAHLIMIRSSWVHPLSIRADIGYRLTFYTPHPAPSNAYQK